MLVIGSPQFGAQDDFGRGDGLCAIPQWTYNFNQTNLNSEFIDLGDLGLDFTLQDIFARLRTIFGHSKKSTMTGPSTILSNTDLHDLTCFVLHRLLSLPPLASVDNQSAILSECVRYGASIYMFVVHGPTYYSHAMILSSLLVQLKHHLEPLISSHDFQDSLLLWLLSVGMVASIGTSLSEWFQGQAEAVSAVFGIRSWEDVEVQLKKVLWLEAKCQVLFQQIWEQIITSNASFHISTAEDVDRATSVYKDGGTTFGV
jgi:hypothetical protein